MYQLCGMAFIVLDSDFLKSIRKTVISWLIVISKRLTKLVSCIVRYSYEFCHHIHSYWKPYLTLLFVPFGPPSMLCVSFCMHIYSIAPLYKWPDFRTQLSLLKTEHVSRHCIGNNVLTYELCKPMLNNLINIPRI